MIGVEVIYQYLVTGILVILAGVSVDQLTHRRRVSEREPILAARGLVKRYGQVVALDGADFDLYPGEILAVIGDNGAEVDADQGALGCPAARRGRRSARRRAGALPDAEGRAPSGIETVYRDAAVAPALDIASNIFLGRERRRRGPLGVVPRMLDRRYMRREAARHFARLKIGVPSITQPVENLSGGQRRGVAVARAAAWGKRLVIMDEPTAALGVKETRRVTSTSSSRCANAAAVILISHDMPHVFELADRIHIGRLGKRVAVVTPQAHDAGGPWRS